MNERETKAERLDREIGLGRVDLMEVREALDKLSTDEVIRALPEGTHTLTFVEPMGGYWKVGDGRPAFADEDPAVMCAIGRCATARVRGGDMPPRLSMVHPERCGWCSEDLGDLMAALDWFVWHCHQVEMERWRWEYEGVKYVRVKGGGQYQNPRIAAFMELPESRRAFLAAMVISQSRNAS